MVAKPSGDEPRTQNMLHGLAQTQVHGQGERSDQLRQSETGIAFAHLQRG